MYSTKIRLMVAILTAVTLAPMLGVCSVRALGHIISEPVQGDGVRRVTPEELREALGKGKAVLIDVRSEESYKAGHVKGARSIPFAQIGARANELPRDKMIATYCS